MASRYKFSDAEIASIKAARRKNKNKCAEARLKALELRAKGMKSADVAKATGFHPAYITALVAKYREKGLEYIFKNHYGGNRRNMSAEEEEKILKPFKERAKRGERVEISEIKAAYQNAVDHTIGKSQIYYVLHRHGWKKIAPRGRQQKKAVGKSVKSSKNK